MCNFIDEIKDPQLRATEILMDTSLSIMLEGECDELLFEKFFDSNCCHIEVMDGKENLLEVLGLVNQKDRLAAIAIIDADLDYIEGIQYDENVFMTDSHDADTDLFLSNAFFKVAREYYSKSQASTNIDLTRIRNTIINLEIPMANLRIYVKEKNLALSFKPNAGGGAEFPYAQFIECNNHVIRYKGDTILVRTACSYNSNQGRALNQQEMVDGINEIKERGYDREIILHGHDLMYIMALSLKRYGKKNKQRRTNEDLESSFRLAYSNDEFRSTHLYNRLREYSADKRIPFLR